MAVCIAVIAKEVRVKRRAAGGGQRVAGGGWWGSFLPCPRFISALGSQASARRCDQDPSCALSLPAARSPPAATLQAAASGF